MKKYFTASLIFLFVFTSTSYSQWIQQTTGTTSWLQSIHFINADVGWAVGTGGKILKTTNGGTSWVTQTSGTSSTDFYSCEFIDANTGWVVGGTWNSAYITRTTNGGTTWTPQTSGTTNTLWSVCFYNQNVGYAGGQAGTMLKTTNGGTNWTAVTSGTTNTFRSVCFYDTGIGWGVGYTGMIRKTTNGGSTWVTQSLPGSSPDLYSVFPLNSNLVFTAGTNGKIAKTTDGGGSWTILNTQTNCGLNCVYFTDSLYGWAAGDTSKILRTTNGGTSWFVQKNTPDIRLFSITAINNQTAWISGGEGTIWKTTNGGGVPVGINEKPIKGNDYSLSQNYPNPFNPVTTIQYSIPEGANIKLILYDALGSKAAVIVDEYKPAGNYTVQFDGSKLASGIYLYRLESGNYTDSKKLILLR